MYIYWFFLFLISVFPPLLLSGCKENNSNNKESLTLILATSGDNPPFEFYQTNGNQKKITGFDVEIAYEIEKVLNISIKIQDMEFSSIIPALLSGRADFAMATIGITDERKKSVSFSDPYYLAQAASMSLKGHTFRVPIDFEGKKIGVQLGSTYEQMMKKMILSLKHAQLIPLNKTGDLLQELKSGRIDVAVIDISPAKAYAENNDDIQANPIDGYQESYAIAFPKNSVWVEKFNDGLRTLKKNGKLAELTNKWFKELNN